MLGQANHFARYAKEKIPYAIKRYINETHRLYRVLEHAARASRRRRASDYVAGDDVSIADFAIFDWSNGYANYAIDEAEFPLWLGLARPHEGAAGGASGAGDSSCRTSRSTSPTDAELRTKVAVRPALKAYCRLRR